MALPLAYPVARWQVVLGKFAGHVTILAFATGVGYGAAWAALAYAGGSTADAWGAFVAMIGSSVLLGAAFVAIGYLVSTMVHDRGTAAGVALGIWLLFVLIYDLALLGVLVPTRGGPSRRAC